MKVALVLCLVIGSVAIEIAEKLKVYDNVTNLVSDANDLLVKGAVKLPSAVLKLRQVRCLLAKADDSSLRSLDFTTDLLHIAEVKAEDRLAEVAALDSVNKAAGLNLTKTQIEDYLINLVLESYQAKMVVSSKLNPHSLLNETYVSLSNIDLKHPLSSSLRVYIDSLDRLDNFIHGVRKNQVGRSVLTDLLNLLKRAKAKHDDDLLDGVSGKALEIYERLVDDLKDLKPLLRA
ncbi:unnamed protein product [Bursaphelenchus okinawaensis]|uniref:Uncharacterized protein n=1 Tax=Bursaphelenchus okinawaensis TaxID=465554 RepID=A0A811K201_9BILA|nr:unnamed protein product [Bursaphelenchus okinawaensis]CAG9090168.1 unnamed protein product [Bursaphelenchus okinawaensis]